MFKGSPSVKILWKKVPQTILASFLTPQNQANACLYLDNSPLNRCPKPSWQEFRPPPTIFLWWGFPKLHGFGNSDMESCILLFCNTGSSVSARQGLHAESHVDSRIQVCRFLPVKIQFISTVIWGMFRTI